MTYSLFDLNEHVRRVVALNFAQPVWITAEIAQAGRSRGHTYLELVQKGADSDILAQGQAVLWAGDFRRLRHSIGPSLDTLLREGLEVKMQVRVDFHERYGLKLLIADLDPAYTFGQLELRRQQTIRTLQESGLLECNRSLPLPPVLQRIAVITSENAAGFQDFREHLEKNAAGYRFDCRLFDASVQGKNAATELCEALRLVAALHGQFDCAVIVRGGGARPDLASFDDLELCRAAARMPLPVFTGIGHDVDQAVLDLVAHASLKTPTAVADFLLQHNLLFETEILRLSGQVRAAGEFRLKLNELELERLETALHWSGREHLRATAQRLDLLEKRLPEMVTQLLQSQRNFLEQSETVCRAFHPENVLRRGYSLTRKNGTTVASATEISAGDLLETLLRDGSVWSEVR